jgi:hypothetical protein
MGTASADYIQLYHGHASLLAESLEVIQQTSARIISVLEPPKLEAAREDLEELTVACCNHTIGRTNEFSIPAVSQLLCRQNSLARGVQSGDKTLGTCRSQACTRAW